MNEIAQKERDRSVEGGEARWRRRNPLHGTFRSAWVG
jgi:hypothetical protein